MAKDSLKVGLVDADLMSGGTRHPNLALMKIAGFLDDNKIPFELISETDADISSFTKIYISRVFSFSQLPNFYLEALPSTQKTKFNIGGTGSYGNEPDTEKFIRCREEDMCQLENDSFLNQFPNQRGGLKKMGIDMTHQMPYYDLYKDFIEKRIAEGAKPIRYKDYMDYSIGFLTRGCFRHCPFCVNKLEKKVVRYSPLSSFFDPSRKYIYLWDDNFLASNIEIWKPLLQELIDTKRPFQFRQGLDERMLAQSPHGEEMAEMLSRAKYHGDFIFAFDNWSDRPIIEKALKVWKKHNPNKGTKFYLFCGFKQSKSDLDLFYKDIWELFQRIRVLMQYKCVGYVMRHEDYHQAPVANFYVQIARWCNQQAFYKKQSFWEFCYRNQSYWEETAKGITDRPKLKSFAEFEADQKSGYYDKPGMRLCGSVQTVLDVLKRFPEHREELLEMFNYKMSELINPLLWQ